MATASSSQPRTWTTRTLLKWTAEYLQKKRIDSPKLAAEMLLSKVLDRPRIKLFMDMDRPASPLELAAYRDLVERAAAQEPVQYLVGEAYFFSMRFKVDKRVLIPRSSTETLVEHVLQHIRHRPGYAHPVIMDICTGSGCIGVALAHHLPAAHVMASDLSGEAIAVAKENAKTHGVADRIRFKQGDLFEALAGERAHFICTNPPYIDDEHYEQLPPHIARHEPQAALWGGPDGLEVIRRIVAQSPEFLLDGGQLVLEFGAWQQEDVLGLAEDQPGLRNPQILTDAEAHPRVLVADRA